MARERATERKKYSQAYFMLTKCPLLHEYEVQRTTIVINKQTDK